MIIIIAKKYLNGRWVEFDANQMYYIGMQIPLTTGEIYIVTTINWSKVTLEVKV